MRSRYQHGRAMRGVLASAILITTPALAQDVPSNPDWDLIRDPQNKLTIAVIAFDSGLGIAVRCHNRAYQALIAGLPPVEGERRTLRIVFGDKEEAVSSWNVALQNDTAVSDFPAPFARELRNGGRVQIIVPDGGGPGRNLRHVLQLPASTAAIDETLTACGRPLVDPRDAELEEIGPTGLPFNLEWKRVPRPDYPGGRTYTRGQAVLTCVGEQDGRLRDCEIESEHPMGGGFGEAALRSTRAARTTPLDRPRRIGFRINFRLD